MWAQSSTNIFSWSRQTISSGNSENAFPTLYSGQGRDRRLSLSDQPVRIPSIINSSNSKASNMSPSTSSIKPTLSSASPPSFSSVVGRLYRQLVMVSGTPKLNPIFEVDLNQTNYETDKDEGEHSLHVWMGWGPDLLEFCLRE